MSTIDGNDNKHETPTENIDSSVVSSTRKTRLELASALQQKEWVNSLHFLKNKESFLEAFDTRFDIPVGTLLLLPALEKKGVWYTMDPYGYRVRILLPNGKSWITFNNNYGLHSGVTAKMFRDKLHTSSLLHEDGFNIPAETTLIRTKSDFLSSSNDLPHAIAFAGKVGYPIVVKPSCGQQGKGVELLHNEEELIAFYKTYNERKKFKDIALLQEFAQGKEYRVIYFNGEILSCYSKVALRLIGDGVKTIEMLLADQQLTRGRTYEDAIKRLQKNNLTLDYIPTESEIINVFDIVNEASSEIESHPYTEKDVDLMKRIAVTLGTDYFGVDIISNDEDISSGKIIEINGLPGIEWASTLDPNLKTKFGSMLVDYFIEKTN